MSYKVTISNGTTLEECIENVSFLSDTTIDNSISNKSKRNSMIIKGKIDTDESITVFYQWALISGNNSDCYKEITVEHYNKDLLVRKVTFSKAFVVDYSESYSKHYGVGTFTIHIRQFYNKDIELTSEEAYSSVDQIMEKSYIVEESVESVEVKKELAENTLKGKNYGKANISFTDRLLKQSKIQDFSNVSDEKLDKIFAKEIEQSKEAYKRAIKVKQQTKKKGCVASNGKVTLSGYGEKLRSSKDFTHVPLETIFEYCKNIGHELPSKVPSSFDNGIKGSFFACHAEKQLSLLTDKPIGITNDMCDNCIEYFSKHAIATKQVKVTTDPKTTRIFLPNGLVRELPKG